MPLDQVIKQILSPGLAMLPLPMDTPNARLMLLTIGRQESRFRFRRQQGGGPARGFWQFEQGGSVKGVMNHPATCGHAHRVCNELDMAWDRTSIWAAMETNDLLALCFARLNLWWAPGPLPEVGDYDAAWKLYADVTWRPGKPRRETWNRYYDEARSALGMRL
ncbi:MAG: hypothetical protein J7605_02460 [Variovorax sp.]|nr:hypothetical protein [Variovorax sp.]